MALEEYDFEKLAREIVTKSVGTLEKPAQAAAEIAKKIIITGVTSTKVRQDPRMTVSGVCRGVMSGMLLNDKSLPETAVTLLNEMANIAQEVNLDPMDVMTWSLEGIAEVALMAGASVPNEIQNAVEKQFMGVGEVFREMCRTIADKKKPAS